jgi:hypothetical protein
MSKVPARTCRKGPNPTDGLMARATAYGDSVAAPAKTPAL